MNLTLTLSVKTLPNLHLCPTSVVVDALSPSPTSVSLSLSLSLSRALISLPVDFSDDDKIEPSEVAEVMNTNSFKSFVVDEVQDGNSDASSFSESDVETVSSSDVAEASVSVQASTGSASSSATLGLMMAAVALVAMRQ